MTNFPLVSILHVTPSGGIELVAANVPYYSLQWNRSMSTCGQFSLSLDCTMPVSWPGRYFVTASGMQEVGVIEKVTAKEAGSNSDLPVLSGRFAECLWSRYEFGAAGSTARGANWRQAVTAAGRTWHMDDIPPLVLGPGTASSTGSSYVLSADKGKNGMETIYGCTSSNGAYPLLSYDRTSDPSHLTFSIIDGIDRTREQSTNPIAVFSVGMGNASSVDYLGDYSAACSVVMAHAERNAGQNTPAVSISRNVSVSGFDANTQWQAQVYEDVSSLIDQETTPTAALVDEGGRLRTYDHMPEVAIDSDIYGEGYGVWWDLADLCEVEIPSLGLHASERIEEVRITAEPSGVSVTATLGTKQISKLMRAMRR